MTTTISPRFTLLPVEKERWAKNTFLFLVPLGIMYLVATIAQVQLDGFQLTDLVPDSTVIGGGVLYVLNSALDFLRKWVPETKVTI